MSEILALDPRLATASNAFSATGFDTRFSDTRAGLSDSVTLFAPTDAAFAELPNGFLDGLSTNELTDVLSFHVGIGVNQSSTPLDLIPLDGKGATLFESDLLAAENDILTLLQGSTIDIEQTSAGVLIDDDATFVLTDIRARNGVVHIIDRVLIAD